MRRSLWGEFIESAGGVERFVTFLEPGRFVRHPAQPGWGLGQVQSVDGARVTVNFEHAGKVLINAAIVTLDEVDP